MEEEIHVPKPSHRRRKRPPSTKFWQRSYASGIPAAHCPDIPSNCNIEKTFVRLGGRQQITLYEHRENGTLYLREVDRGTDGLVDEFDDKEAAEDAIDELKTRLKNKAE